MIEKLIRRLVLWRVRRRIERTLDELELPDGYHRIFSGGVDLTVQDYEDDRDREVEP